LPAGSRSMALRPEPPMSMESVTGEAAEEGDLGAGHADFGVI